MDHMSSPVSISSSSATAPSSTSKQPTYTTAGTIYNPGSSQPLQPPTRRGRSFKWSTGGVHPDLVFLPKSVLAGLPLKPGMGRTPPVQHYTPLQQNYDRAVSPLYDPDHIMARMPTQISHSPRMRSGNTPSLAAKPLSESNQDRPEEIVDAVGDDNQLDEDDDSDLNDPLMNMPVKSLHNLASYPNPNQKRAQKALRRGAPLKPTLSELTGPSRLSASSDHFVPSSHSQTRIPSPSLKSFISRTLRPTHSDPSVLRRVQVETQSSADQDRASAYHALNMRHPSPDSCGDPGGPTAVSRTLASGPGAPRPLTAGPPGQRQYRPSTFESTFKALHTQSTQQSCVQNDADAIAITQQTMLQAGIDDFALPLDSISSAFDVDDAADSQSHRDEQVKNGIQPMTNLIPPTTVFGKGRDSVIGERYFHHNRSTGFTLRRMGDFPYEDVLPSILTGPQSRFKSGTDRLTDDELAARNEKINRWWYAGSDMMTKTPEAAVGELQFQRSDRLLGFIGDRRSNKTRLENRPMSIEEANAMPVSEHAKPLLNMAFASLVRNIHWGSLPYNRDSFSHASFPEHV